MNILLAITFVYGVVNLLTMTKLFESRLYLPIKSFVGGGAIGKFSYLDVWFFYFSLIFQAWYWLFK